MPFSPGDPAPFFKAPTASTPEFLVREVLKEAGDAVVLEPADAREAVLLAAEKLFANA